MFLAPFSQLPTNSTARITKSKYQLGRSILMNLYITTMAKTLPMLIPYSHYYDIIIAYHLCFVRTSYEAFEEIQIAINKITTMFLIFKQF